MSSKRKQVSSNMLWSIFERLSSQIIAFVVSLMLARLILPEVYGVVMVVSAVVNIFSMLVQSSFYTSLVYADADIRHYSTAFWSILAITGLLYVGLFFMSPLIAMYYGTPEITMYFRVMSLLFILQGIQSIPHAYIAKKMLFRKNYIATIIGIVVSAAVAIFLASKGYGAWALVVMGSVEVLVSTAVLWVILKFKIAWYFDFKIAKDMMKYCWKIAVVDVLNAAYSSLSSLVIGKRFTANDVAYYNKSYTLPQVLLGSVNTAVSKVLFPALSESKSSLPEVRDKLRRSIMTLNYVVFPMMVGLAVVAKPVIIVLYTEKWLGIVPYLQIMCGVWMLQPIQTSAIQAFKAIGKNDIYMKAEFFKKICGIIVLIALIFLLNDPIAIALSVFAGQVISCVINMALLKTHLQYKYRTQLSDALSSLWLSGIMAIVVWVSGGLAVSPIAKVAFQILIGMTVYVLLSVVTKNANYKYIIDIMHGILSKRTAEAKNEEER